MIVVFICSSYALVNIIETIKIYYNYEVILAFDKNQDIPIKFPAMKTHLMNYMRSSI
jgi:hypothetical protein